MNPAVNPKMNPKMNPAMSCRDVSVIIDGRNILSQVSLDVHMGEVLAIVGPNGAGKSTLLSVLAGDRAPTVGTVTAGGRELRSFRPIDLARLRAVLPQQTQTMFSFTAQAVVEMGRFPTIDRGSDATVVAECLARTSITALAHRSFPTLSGGEQTLVNLARVLAQSTPVMLLDEPTAALDIAHQELVCEIARDATSRGVAVVVVLHELNLAARFADRIVLLNGGVISAEGNPNEVLRSDLLSVTYGHRIEVLAHPLMSGTPLVLPMPSVPTGLDVAATLTNFRSKESSEHVIANTVPV
jgi:iron complex transport system ATP-binding protein